MWRAGAALHRGARASHYRGLSCYGAQAPDAQAQQLWLTGLVAPRHVGSSQTGARTRVPCIGRQILNHCATREAQEIFFKCMYMMAKISKRVIMWTASVTASLSDPVPATGRVRMSLKSGTSTSSSSDLIYVQFIRAEDVEDFRAEPWENGAHRSVRTLGNDVMKVLEIVSLVNLFVKHQCGEISLGSNAFSPSFLHL